MTCKDCIHYEVCKKTRIMNPSHNYAAECNDYNDRSRFVELPCKVGDTLYRVNKGAKEPVIMMRVIQLYIKQIHKDRTVMRIDAINDTDMGESCYLPCDIGERIFLTREEAEAKLKEMEGESDVL